MAHGGRHQEFLAGPVHQQGHLRQVRSDQLGQPVLGQADGRLELPLLRQEELALLTLATISQAW